MHESGSGTFVPFVDVRYLVAIEGEADIQRKAPKGRSRPETTIMPPRNSACFTFMFVRHCIHTRCQIEMNGKKRGSQSRN